MNNETKYTNILIITDELINNNLLNEFDHLIVNDFKFNNHFSGAFNDQLIEFDYLITSKKIIKNVMTEDGFIITNESFETSFDNYFAFGKIIKNEKNTDEQLNIILEYIKGN